ncbi:MAG: glutaredoxin [Clostridia bacterium]|nr:glutaredoxin [Clostridia bacterium]
MLTIYGSAMCPDCRSCTDSLDDGGIAYQYVDINESLQHLKAFLRLRDTCPVFDPVRGTGTIGIPAIVFEDGTVTVDWEGYLTNQGRKAIAAQGQACSVENRRC